MPSSFAPPSPRETKRITEPGAVAALVEFGAAPTTASTLYSQAVHRMMAYGGSAVLLVLTLMPAFREPWAQDSFPMSTYPMFSHTRPREMRLAHAVAVVEDGRRVPVPPKLVAGTSEVLQSMAVVARAVRQGKRRRDRVCREIARRVGNAEFPEGGSVRRIELSVDLFDTVAYFEEAPEPLERRVVARCAVEGR